MNDNTQQQRWRHQYRKKHVNSTWFVVFVAGTSNPCADPLGSFVNSIALPVSPLGLIVVSLRCIFVIAEAEVFSVDKAARLLQTILRDAVIAWIVMSWPCHFFSKRGVGCIDMRRTDFPWVYPSVYFDVAVGLRRPINSNLQTAHALSW